MSPGVWHTIVLGSSSALACEAFFGFGLAFNPGWANGWPFGLTIHMVWPAGMSLLFFLLAMTAAVDLGAIVGATCSRNGVGLHRGRAAFITWLIGSGVVAMFASVWILKVISAQALEEWPNGYGPR